MSSEFSFKTREKNLSRLRSEKFDFLIVGGGITGAASARDAALRGFKVALIEKGDFASGTSSTSSKLVHGGLRYLENYEFRLVFESLSERSWQLKDLAHLVRPLKFFIPVYWGEKRGMSLISLGLWLYDLLSLLRAPGFHKRHSRKMLLQKLPGLKEEGLKGGFSYYDATMWDDLLVIENLRSAANAGAAAVNYVEGVSPVMKGDQVGGFRVRDGLTKEEFEIEAERVIVCAGPWTDQVGEKVSGGQISSGQISSGQISSGNRVGQKELPWRKVLKPSRGIHLVFPREKIPVEGAVLMLHPDDGRVSFVMPRDDFGPGVVIVGTTDGPASKDPDHQPIPREDEAYLIDLLGKFFPGLKLTENDVISRYIGIRPLIGGDASGDSLAKVSREHWIETFPNGVTYVAGGKYTTHREMAVEIVKHSIASWDELARKGVLRRVPRYSLLNTQRPVLVESSIPARPNQKPAPLHDLSRYGGEAQLVRDYDREYLDVTVPEASGFALLKGQFLFSVRHEMVMNLEDFYYRRAPLYLARKDHGEPYAETLAEILRREFGAAEKQKAEWVSALKASSSERSKIFG